MPRSLLLDSRQGIFHREPPEEMKKKKKKKPAPGEVIFNPIYAIFLKGVRRERRRKKCIVEKGD